MSTIFLNTLTPLILFYALVCLLKSSWFKGKLGEYQVNQLLKTLNIHYTVTTNVTLPIDNGTTQIDQIVFSPYGIFVIETKNMQGWIFGGVKQKTWTQKIYKKNYPFQNPLHQNYLHTKTMAHILQEPHENFHSIVVFLRAATFKTDMARNVIQHVDLIDYIQSFKQVVYSDEQIEGFIEKLSFLALNGNFLTDIKHVQGLKNRHKNKE